MLLVLRGPSRRERLSLVISAYNLATVGRRTFPVSTANLWNSRTSHFSTVAHGFQAASEDFSLPALLSSLNYLTLTVYMHSAVDQRSITRSEKKCCLKSNRHLFFTSLVVCPLVRVAVCRTKKSLNGVDDEPLYILKTSNKSALFLLSSRVHSPKYSSHCS